LGGTLSLAHQLLVDGLSDCGSLGLVGNHNVFRLSCFGFCFADVSRLPDIGPAILRGGGPT
jgi:hypothetical protein